MGGIPEDRRYRTDLICLRQKRKQIKLLKMFYVDSEREKNTDKVYNVT